MKIAPLISHLFGRRGILLAVTLATALAWLVFRDHRIAPFLGALSLGLASGLILLISYAISEVHRDVRSLARTQTTASRKPPETHTPDDESLRRRHLAQSLWLLASGSRAREEDEALAITVVIPCFNEERFISDAIASVKQQSFERWECVVVDDASTDGSLSAIWAAIDDDDRFRVIRHRVNGGLSASRNTGLREARGQLVTFLDGDDLLMQNSLLDRYIAFQAHRSDPHVVGSYCGVVNAPEDAKLEDFPAGQKWGSRWQDRKIIDLVTARGECPFSAHAPLLRTDLVRRVGGFDESITSGGEDWDLWLRLMRNGYVFIPGTYRSAVYRQKLGSMIRAGASDHAKLSAELIRAAHQPADASVLTHPSPNPMVRPISHYEEGITRAARLLRFAAAALTREHPQDAREILEHMPDLSESIVRRHVDIDRQFRRGVGRALGYTGPESIEIEQASSSIRTEFDRLISSAFAEPERVSNPSVEVIDFLLIPQHAGHLRSMLDSLPNDAGHAITVLNLDRECGDQGVARHIPEDVDVVTLNTLDFRSPDVRQVLVGSVRDGLVEALVRGLIDKGAMVEKVEGEFDEIMRIAAAHERIGLESRTSRTPNRHTPDETTKWPTDRIELSWEAIIREENPETLFDADKLASFKDLYRGERAVIIGNGPSLNQLDLALLKNEKTFAVNAIFLAQEQMGFDPTFYVVEDTAVMADNLEAIKSYKAEHKFFPSIYRDLIGDQPNATYFMMNRGFYSASSPNFCVPRFATDVSQQVFSGQSVTIMNLQLAYHMGFSEVVLIGMDFSYVIPDDAAVEGNLITSQSDDPNHFHPEYFGRGKVWKDPKLDRVLACYALAKRMFETDGRRIVNATAGGKLELFDRADFEKLFG